MKRILAVGMVGALALSAAAAVTTTRPVRAQDELKNICLVTDVGQVDDRSFNQSAWEGAQAAAAELGGKATYIETRSDTDYAKNIDLCIEPPTNDIEPADIVVTVGFALGEATITAAGTYPDVQFIGVDQFQETALPNVTGLIFAGDQAGFLAGVLAASMTKTGTIAAVLGKEIPPVAVFKEGYEAGAKYTKSDIRILSTYHPGGFDIAFSDPQFGATTAGQAVDQGADVVFGAGGKTGNGALEEVAKRTTTDKPLYCIGVDSDQWETVPAAQPCLISSAMKLIDVGVVDVAKAMAAGEAEGGNFQGDVGLASFHDFDDVIPQDVQDKLVEIKAQLENGELNSDGTVGTPVATMEGTMAATASATAEATADATTRAEAPSKFW